MERMTKRDIYGCPILAKDIGYLKLLEHIAKYEDEEEQGLIVRLPKNFKFMAARKKTESNAIINELIHAMCPYADDDRLFKAVDAIRVFVAQQNDFIDILSNSEAAIKEG